MSREQDRPLATRLIIARHGNTFAPEAIVTRVGKTDLPLVDSGRYQGKILGQYLKQHQLIPDIIFTSQLLRTQQTADEIEAVLSTRLPRYVLDIFNEIDYGPDENQPEASVRNRLGDAVLDAWDKNAIVPPGWLVDVEGVIKAWRSFADDILLRYTNKTILVVSSNGMIRFAPHLTGDMAAFTQEHHLKVATGALCSFIYNPETSSWICSAWNLRPNKI
jgi:2,3-bisphosphoglycerate-dependent phosphoglycerate mutase